MNQDFQTKVYNVVARIPKGQVCTYKQVAYLAGRPTAWRAVGNILKKNYDLSIDFQLNVVVGLISNFYPPKGVEYFIEMAKNKHGK